MGLTAFWMRRDRFAYRGERLVEGAGNLHGPRLRDTSRRGSRGRCRHSPERGCRFGTEAARLKDLAEPVLDCREVGLQSRRHPIMGERSVPLVEVFEDESEIMVRRRELWVEVKG